MELGMIGLGRMGGNMAQRLIDGGHKVVAYDPIEEAVGTIVRKGANGALSYADLASKLTSPRAIWLMVPSGEPVETAITTLASELSPDDVVIDGGNSYYKDSMRRATTLADKGILFLDVGTSGGVWGLKEGYCLMVGGSLKAYRRLEPIFQTLAPSPQRGYGYVGPRGAGHFVKMIHNGIEYGLMQSYAEGFELLQAKHEFDLDLKTVAEIWRHGSVVRSWLLDLVALVFQEDPRLESIQGYVEDSGEVRWAVQESIELAIPAPIITQSLQTRFRSRQGQSFGAKLLATLRQKFGGHAVKKAE